MTCYHDFIKIFKTVFLTAANLDRLLFDKFAEFCYVTHYVYNI